MAQNLDKRQHKCLQHSKRHIAYVNSIVPRPERWSMGAALVNGLRGIVADREKAMKGRCKGYAALNCGGQTRQFWVVKKPGASGLKRGNKVFRKAMKDKLELESGTTFRTITTPAVREVRTALSGMAKAIADVHHPAQYGFVPQRDCVASAAKHVYAKALFLIDFENAFDQVDVCEVFEILTGVFLINKETASQLARLCTTDRDTGGGRRHMYQGHPMAPALFNIRAAWCVERLSRLCATCGLTLTVYADDLCISSDSWTYFSKGFRKTVYRIIRECGLKVNPKKCHVRAVDARKVGHYDITGLTVDFDKETGVPYVRPLHRRRVLGKAAYIGYLRSRGCEFSSELARDGTPKSLADVELGLEGWGQRKPRPGDYPDLRLPSVLAPS